MLADRVGATPFFKKAFDSGRRLQFCSHRRGLKSLLGPEDTAREVPLWTLTQHRARRPLPDRGEISRQWSERLQRGQPFRLIFPR
jgi:hypothetical protein